MALLDERTRKRFWSKVSEPSEPGGCRPWLGKPTEKGYGRLRLGSRGGRVAFAHQVAWVVAHDAEIPSGAVVHHTCGRADCVEPAHLSLMRSQAEHVAREHADGPPTLESNRARACAHLAGDDIESLGVDAGTLYLAWVWHSECTNRGRATARIVDRRSADASALRRLFLSAADEREASLALIEIVRNWPEYRVYAVCEYAVWRGLLDRAPLRPVLSMMSGRTGGDGVASVLGYWRASSGGRRLAAQQIERARLLHEYGSTAWLRRREIWRAEWEALNDPVYGPPEPGPEWLCEMRERLSW